MKFVVAGAVVILGCARFGVFGKGETIDYSKDNIVASRYVNFWVATSATHWVDTVDYGCIPVSRWSIRPFDVKYKNGTETRRF